MSFPRPPSLQVIPPTYRCYRTKIKLVIGQRKVALYTLATLQTNTSLVPASLAK